MTAQIESIKTSLRNDPRAPLGVISVLGLCAVISLGSTIGNLFTDLNAPITKTHTFKVQATLPEISTFHLFGQFQDDSGNLPQTNLQLTLQGIAFSNQASQPSMAIIATPDGKTKAYRNGDTLPSGAYIQKINRNNLFLNDHGRLETLSLPIPTLNNRLYTNAK